MSAGYAVGGNGGGGGASFSLDATAWVDPSGNDATGAIGDPSKPYKNPLTAQNALLSAGKIAPEVIVNAGAYLTSQGFTVRSRVPVSMALDAVVTQDDDSMIVEILNGDNEEYVILGYGSFYCSSATVPLFRATGFASISKLSVQYLHIESTGFPPIFTTGTVNVQFTGMCSDGSLALGKAMIRSLTEEIWTSDYIRFNSRVCFTNCDLFPVGKAVISNASSDANAKVIFDNCNLRNSSIKGVIELTDAIDLYFINNTKMQGGSVFLGGALGRVYYDNNIISNQAASGFGAVPWGIPLTVVPTFVIP